MIIVIISDEDMPSIAIKKMPKSELHMLKIKTRVKYEVSPFEETYLKLRKITCYGKSSISSF